MKQGKGRWCGRRGCYWVVRAGRPRGRCHREISRTCTHRKSWRACKMACCGDWATGQFPFLGRIVPESDILNCPALVASRELESWSWEAKPERKGPCLCSREESQGKKRSIHVVNGTLFLPVTGERKGTFPSGSGERKGPLWGEKPALVVRKEIPARPVGLTEKEDRPSPSALCFEGVRRRHF